MATMTPSLPEMIARVMASKKKPTKHEAAAMRRINRADAECNATILRAIDRALSVLQRERTEHLIRMDRKKKGVRR